MEKTNEWATLPELKPMVTIEWEKLQILVRNQERLYAIVSGVEDYKTFDEITQKLAEVQRELDATRIQNAEYAEKYETLAGMFTEVCKAKEALEYNYNSQVGVITTQLEDIGNLKEEIEGLKGHLKNLQADYDKALERNDKLEHLCEESERLASHRADDNSDLEYQLSKLKGDIKESNRLPWWKKMRYNFKI